MVKVYINLIQQGLKTIDDVPLSIREQVRLEIEKLDNKEE